MVDAWTESVRARVQQVGGRAARVYTFTRAQPTWVTKIAVAAATLVLVGIVLLLVVPAIVIGLIAFFALVGVARVRGLFRRVREPGGMLDQRRNVKVITRDEP